MQCAEIGEERLRALKGAGLGRLEPAERRDVLDSAGLEGEDHLGEVQALDLGQLLRGAIQVLPLRPKAEADARGGATGATRALIGRSAADFLDEQGIDPAIGIEPGDAGEAAIDDDADPIDSEGSLGDVGGHDDLPPAVGGQGGVLIGHGQLAMEGEDDEIIAYAGTADGVDGPMDFKRAGHEDEHVALGLASEALDFIGGHVPNGDVLRAIGARQVLDIDGIGAALGPEHGAWIEECPPAGRYPGWRT